MITFLTPDFSDSIVLTPGEADIVIVPEDNGQEADFISLFDPDDRLDFSAFDDLTADILLEGAISNDDAAVPFVRFEGEFGSITLNGTSLNQLSAANFIFNSDPVANPDVFQTQQNNPISLNVLVNDFDPDGDPVVISEFPTLTLRGGAIAQQGNDLVYTPSLNFTGVDFFTYTISDGEGGFDSAQVTVNVQGPPPNTPPVANPDSTTTVEGSAVTINVLSNDTDADGDPLTISNIVANPVNGNAVIVGNSISYTPRPGFDGPDSFSYRISDGRGGFDTAQVTVQVIDVNTPPVANPDSTTTEEGTPVTINVLGNDSDADGDPLTISNIVANPVNGNAVIVGNSIRYTPRPGFEGPDSFTYRISDGQGGFATGQVTVQVIDSNVPPIAVGDVAIATGGPVLIDVLDNDFDPNGDIISISNFATISDNGGTILEVGNQLQYRPNPGFSGIDRFEYTITDGNGETDTATAIVVVEDGNTPPEAVPDATTVAPGATITIDVLANDTDPDGDPLTIQGVENPANGTAVIQGNRIVYTSDDGSTGEEVFTYTISDGRGGSDTATITVTVDEPGFPPVADDETVTTLAGTPVPIDVLEGDTDPDGPDDQLRLGAFQRTTPNGGTVNRETNGTPTTTDDTLVYTPADGFTGTDTFVYRVLDVDGLSDIGTVTVIVDPAIPLGQIEGVKFEDSNGDGVFDDDEVGLEGFTIYLDVNENGVLDDDEPSAVTEADGSYIFEDLSPDTYNVREVQQDGFAPTTPEVVVVEVEEGETETVNFGNIPIIELVSISGTKFEDVNEDGVFDDDEVGLEGFTIYLDVNENGVLDDDEPSAVTGADGSYIFEDLLPGTYNVREVQQDGFMPTTPEVVVVELAPGEAGTADFGNAPIIPLGSISGTKFEDVNENGVFDDGEVGLEGFTIYLDLDNDGMLDDDEPSTVTAADGSYSFEDLEADTYVVREQPREGFVPTTDAVTVELAEGEDVENVNFGNIVFIEPGSIAGVKFNDLNEDGIRSEGEPGLEGFTIYVDLNDNEVLDLDEPSAVTGSDGTYSIENLVPGTYIVREVPQDGFTPTTDAVEVEVESEGIATADFGNVADNLPPVAEPDAAIAISPDAVTIDVLNNDFDEDGDPIQLTEFATVGTAGGGTVTRDNGGTPFNLTDDQLIYTPDSTFVGTDTFTYTISDGQGGTASAEVTVTVELPPNTPPVAEADATTTRGTMAVAIDVLENDFDEDGDTLIIFDFPEVTGGGGEVVIDQNGTPFNTADDSLVYIPAPGFAPETDSFTYTISDGNGGFASNTVTVTVEDDDPPIAEDDAAIASENVINAPIPVLDNDVVVADDGEPLTVTDVGNGLNGGTVSISEDGTQVLYTAPGGFTGEDTFTYTVTDAVGGTDTAVVTIDLQPEDDPIVGTAGEDLIVGDDLTTSGDDRVPETLQGGAGDDTIIGGGGADILSAGPGGDTFAYLSLTDSGADPANPFEPGDTINDFDPNVDTIVLDFEVAPGNPVDQSEVEINLLGISSGVASIGLNASNTEPDFLPEQFVIVLTNLPVTTTEEDIRGAIAFDF